MKRTLCGLMLGFALVAQGCGGGSNSPVVPAATEGRFLVAFEQYDAQISDHVTPVIESGVEFRIDIAGLSSPRSRGGIDPSSATYRWLKDGRPFDPGIVVTAGQERRGWMIGIPNRHEDFGDTAFQVVAEITDQGQTFIARRTFFVRPWSTVKPAAPILQTDAFSGDPARSRYYNEVGGYYVGILDARIDILNGGGAEGAREAKGRGPGGSYWEVSTNGTRLPLTPSRPGWWTVSLVSPGGYVSRPAWLWVYDPANPGATPPARPDW
ncbi:MAG: hypothetical protein WCT32_02805 [Patescibacteria group bacterium]